MSDILDGTRGTPPTIRPENQHVEDPDTEDLRALDSQTVLDQIASMRTTADTAEARLLALAVHYVDLHPATPSTPAANAADQGSSSLWSDEPQRLAGDGTPAIADHAIEALGATLTIPYTQALSLVADAVALCYRLPRLYATLHTGQVPTWKARLVARETLALSLDAADYVDRQLAITTARRRWPTLTALRDLVHEAALRDDPDHDKAQEETAAAQRGVWFDHHTKTAGTATTKMTATLDAWDALHLDNTLADLAHQMGRLGDTSNLDTRRANALNLLTHPQQLLDLTDTDTSTGTDTATQTDADDATDTGTGTGTGTGTDTGTGTQTDTDADDETGKSPASPASPATQDSGSGQVGQDGQVGDWNFGRSNPGSRSTINLYVHTTLADLAASTAITAMGPETQAVPGSYTGCALIERLGPALLAIVATWAGRTDRIIVRPVLDPTSATKTSTHPDASAAGAGAAGAGAAGAAAGAGAIPGLDQTATRPVDQHDPPAAMREHVILRDGTCVFPGCHLNARSCDLDHITPYQDPAEGGPPGKTHPDNLAALCRRHHRLKTHTAWGYQRHPATPDPGHGPEPGPGSYTWTSPTGRTYTTHPQPSRAFPP